MFGVKSALGGLCLHFLRFSLLQKPTIIPEIGNVVIKLIACFSSL